MPKEARFFLMSSTREVLSSLRLLALGRLSAVVAITPHSNKHTLDGEEIAVWEGH